MGSMRVDRLGGLMPARRLVVDNPASDDLVVREFRVAKLRLRRIAGVVEARMREVDTAVDDGDLDTCACPRRSATLRPGLRRADQRDVGICRRRVVKTLVLGAQRLRRRGDRRQGPAGEVEGGWE